MIPERTTYEVSIQASFAILAILLIRFLFKRIPKHFICLLWTLAAVRLICPYQITSPLSLVPDTSIVQELADLTHSSENTGNPPTNEHPISVDISSDTDVISTSPQKVTHETREDSVSTYIHNAGNNTTTILSISGILAGIWLLGMIALLCYGLISYARTKRLLQEAVHTEDNIWLSDRIECPFVLGYLKPRIYIPFSVDKVHMPYIIAHEKAHITRFDHFGKILGYLLLSIYWFQPFVWIAYYFYCKDLELACDERVVRNLDIGEKKAYSEALLVCSVSNKTLLQSPIAFSELGVKERIMNVLHYKKPGFLVVVAAITVCVVAVLCFMTSPKSADNSIATETSETFETNTELTTENTIGSDTNLADLDAGQLEVFRQIITYDYNDFVATERIIDGNIFAEFRYRDDTDDILIMTDTNLNVVSLSYNGEEKPLPEQKLQIFYAGSAYGVPYFTDVTGDGQKDFFVEIGGGGTGSYFSECFVYQLDTMEQLQFNKNVYDITSQLSVTLTEFTPEKGKLHFLIEYNGQTAECDMGFEHTKEKHASMVAPGVTLEEANEYFSYSPVSETDHIYYSTEKQCFVSEIWLWVNNTYFLQYIGELVVEYVWDENAKEFVPDLDTVVLTGY